MPRSVMIVDDNEIIRRKLRELFKKDHDWVVCAEAVDGREAVESARKFHPEFVVLDYSMPTMDGLEAAPKLKDVSPRSSIVMLTSFKDRFLEEKAYKAGVSWGTDSRTAFGSSSSDKAISNDIFMAARYWPTPSCNSRAIRRLSTSCARGRRAERLSIPGWPVPNEVLAPPKDWRTLSWSGFVERGEEAQWP
jgi:CheY-like chemotaxis protein